MLWSVAGHEHSEWYETEKDRDKRYAQLAKERKRGTLPTVLARQEAEEWRAFNTSIAGADWREVVAGWRAWLAESGKSPCTLTIKEASEIFLQDGEKRVLNGTLALDTMRHRRQKIRMFADSFGANRLTQLTPPEVEAWIDDLGFEAPATFNSWRAHVRAFYSHFADQVPINPAAKTRVRSDLVDHVAILTVEQAAKLLAYTLKQHPEALGRLACEAFVGLRFASGYRLEKTDINFAKKGITLPARKIKTKRRYYVDGLPENLWPWLEKTNDACWTLTPAEYMHLKSSLFAGAGVPHPHNCLRHSFATYHLAANKGPGRTATILCHESEKKLWERYNGMATEEDARRYFSITPLTVEQLAKPT